MEGGLLDLPQVCLEEIFKKLSFLEISRLGATCKYFREIAKTIFRLYLNTLEETIEAEMENIENEANQLENLTISQHLHLAFLHSVLRILLAEAKMLKAHCWRYMADPAYDFCFPGGVIIDEFERILRHVKKKTFKKDMEPQITATLFYLGKNFYDNFDFVIENHIRQYSEFEEKATSETNRKDFLPKVYNFAETPLKDVQENIKNHSAQRIETLFSDKRFFGKKNEAIKFQEKGSNAKTLFGVKILDILNCSSTSNCHTMLFHNCENNGFKLETHFELRRINALEALPASESHVTNLEKQLKKICMYIRNNVRWTNLFHPLEDFCTLEDAIEINPNISTASALLRQWKLQRASSRYTLQNVEKVHQYDYIKEIGQFKNQFRFLITANLECPTINDIPLKVSKCLETKFSYNPNTIDVKTCESPTEMFDVEEWNNSISTYKFHLELKIQYASFLSERVKEAILKVDQIDGKTTVTTDGDDMRKSATYRADPEKYD